MRTRFQYRDTILSIVCDDGMSEVVRDAVLESWFILESKIGDDPFFGITYDPYPVMNSDHEMIRRMCEASSSAGVGPMAGVAGAVAENVARELIDNGSSVAIVENGGDIAFYSMDPVSVGIFADHPVFKDVAFSIDSDHIIGICSSSRTVGPSVSFGNSSISTVFSDDVILADCCATALGNMVTDADSLQDSVEDIGSIEGVTGCMACCDDKVAFFGDIPPMVPANCSNITY